MGLERDDISEEYPLDPEARKELHSHLEDVKEALLMRAYQLSEIDTISLDALKRAVNEYDSPVQRSRRIKDVQEVISQALNENRRAEYVAYAMILILFVFGLFLLAVGAWADDAATRIGSLLAGSIVELLILAPLRFAINSRRHNIAVRMLGVVLNRVDDPKDLAPLLKDTFLAIVLAQAPSTVSDTKR